MTEGNAQTVIQLDIGMPIDRAVEDVRSAIQQIRGELPDGILEPQVGRADTTSNDLASFTAVAPDMTQEQLSWYIDNTVSKELRSVSGLAAVNRNGGVDREIRVILDPAKLQSYGLNRQPGEQPLRQGEHERAGRQHAHLGHDPVGARARQRQGRLCARPDADRAGRRAHRAARRHRPGGGSFKEPTSQAKYNGTR